MLATGGKKADESAGDRLDIARQRSAARRRQPVAILRSNTAPATPVVACARAADRRGARIRCPADTTRNAARVRTDQADLRYSTRAAPVRARAGVFLRPRATAAPPSRWNRPGYLRGAATNHRCRCGPGENHRAHAAPVRNAAEREPAMEPGTDPERGRRRSGVRHHSRVRARRCVPLVFLPFAAGRSAALRRVFPSSNMLPRHSFAPQRQAKISSTLGASSRSRWIW